MRHDEDRSASLGRCGLEAVSGAATHPMRLQHVASRGIAARRYVYFSLWAVARGGRYHRPTSRLLHESHI
jgi:hypothetical protein